MAEGLYRIGECIFMEVHPPPTPYQICKIEELRKNSKGSVEVAAKCFYRRKDLPPNLLLAADRHAMAVEEENELDSTLPRANNYDRLTELQRHQIKHRELFLSRQIETYKIDMVRGKCSVSLLNELENVESYLEKEDTFFYTMVYDPNQKTLLVDKGEIRVGPDYQADVTSYVPPSKRKKESEHSGEKLWEPSKMSDQKVEQFLVVSRSIGTFARALLDGAKKPQISLRLGAAAASRDITLFHAMDTLHQSVYDISTATSKLVPRGPVLCADELEAWSQEEAKRFEEGLQDEKNFLYIQRRYLPWKSMKSIVAYYYMWKTTDRYQIQKRHRMIEKQNDLKEVIVHLRTPSGAPPTGPRDLSGKAASAGDMLTSIPKEKQPPMASDEGKGCESCYTTTSSRWASWGPAHEHCRLCGHCYIYWRKYGGLKLPTRWEAIDTSAAATQAGSVVQTPLEKKPLKDRPDKAAKKSPKMREDIVPHHPFFMVPTALVLFLRKSLGTPFLLKTARSPFKRIDTHQLPKPSTNELQNVVSSHKTGRKRKKPTLANLPKAISSPPKQFRLHNSPMPISPSYKKTKAPKLKVTPTAGVVSTSGTYIPPKGPSPPLHPLTEQKKLVTILPDSPQPIRKREAPDKEDLPPSKLPKVSATTDLPSEIFYQSTDQIKDCRKKIGQENIRKLARSPVKGSPLTHHSNN